MARPIQISAYNKPMNGGYTLYLDESGVANLADTRSNYFVMSGLIVDDKEDIELSAYLRHIKRRHKIEPTESLHAVDLFEIENHKNFLTSATSKLFTNSIAEFIENAPFKIIVVAVDKQVLRRKMNIPDGYKFKGSKTHKKDKEVAYELLTRKMIFEFAKFLNKKGCLGSIVAESRRGSDNLVLGTYLDCQEPQTFVQRKSLAKLAVVTKERVHSICFATKVGAKGGLELADIVSYCSFNELKNNLRGMRRNGVQQMFARIKADIGIERVSVLSLREISGLIPDRIHEITDQIEKRRRDFSDMFGG